MLTWSEGCQQGCKCVASCGRVRGRRGCAICAVRARPEQDGGVIDAGPRCIPIIACLHAADIMLALQTNFRHLSVTACMLLRHRKPQRSHVSEHKTLRRASMCM